MPNLEKRLFSDIKKELPIDIERALLIVAGLKTEKQISEYQEKLDTIIDSFKDYQQEKGQGWRSGSPNTAESLHEYLWDCKPYRAKGDSYLLTEVIDSQLDEDQFAPVGDCLGLTSLYSVLGLRLGLDLNVLDSPRHILSLLHAEGKDIKIENTNPEGFRWSFPKTEDRLPREAPLLYLVAGVINNKAYFKIKQNHYLSSLKYYNQIKAITPHYEGVFPGLMN